MQGNTRATDGSSEAGRHRESQKLLERALRVIPGGHHLSGRPLLQADDSPLYMARGQGAHCWDVDGHQYLDYIGAYGPFLLGYANAAVDAAAVEQLRGGNLLSLNHPLHVEFAERLVKRLPGAEMAAFFKTGSEATTAALRIARRATGRKGIVRCGYHGWHDWCLPEETFVPAGLAAQVTELDAAHPESLEALLVARAGEIAAVIVAPEMILPSDPQVFAQLLRTTREAGAVFILDEIKTGLRIKPGSFQQYVGIVPDLTTLSKALGNGWPIAAVVGRRAVMEHAAGMHLSATYHGDTAAMAAALTTLELVDRDRVYDHVWAIGEALIEGLNASAERHGIPAVAYGEPLPPMPFLKFNAPDPALNSALIKTFYGYCFQHGVLFHPRHLWFVSYAHSRQDIWQTLEVAHKAFAHTAREHRAALARR